ncbi:MAG: dienelactone hydrolase family protein [Pseudomonadota bacterium]
MPLKYLLLVLLALSVPAKIAASDELPEHAGFRYAIVGNCDPSRPTVVGLHFMGGNAALSRTLFDLSDQGFNFVGLEGRHPFETGRSWFTADHYAKPVSDQSAEIIEEADALAIFLQEIDTICPTSGRPIVTGYSQGGDLVHMLAIRHARHIGAAVPMGARFFDSWRYLERDASARTPIVVLHGGQDGVVSPTNALRAAEFYAIDSRDVTLRLFQGVGHAYPPEMRGFYRMALRDLVSRPTSDGAATDL